MADKYKINGQLTVGKGAGIKNIGEGTKVTSIDKDDAKKHGINAKEFDKLVDSGVLTAGGAGASAAAEKAGPQPLSAVAFKKFSGAVEQLDKNELKHWTSDNKPDVAALKERGSTLTATERDEAWELYIAE